MLWDNVYNFFIQYIFGGYTTQGAFHGILGKYFSNTTGQWYDADTGGVFDDISIYTLSFGNKLVPLGNYLSLIATIISMVVIVVLCCLLIKKIYNICAHIIG